MFLLGFGALGAADPANARGGSQVCQDAAQQAARQTGVPASVLLAVSLTETGRTVDGQFESWPWTLNIAGSGHWLPDQKTALALADRTRLSGHRNFDVGCFQVNYRWHGDAFPTLQAMMDPLQNALYAARFLARLHRETGDWATAASFYHSRTPKHAQRYRKIFERHLAAVSSGALPRLSRSAPMTNTFPLLQGGGRTSGASLVPTDMGKTRSLLGPAAKPFWTGS